MQCNLYAEKWANVGVFESRRHTIMCIIKKKSFN